MTHELRYQVQWFEDDSESPLVVVDTYKDTVLAEFDGDNPYASAAADNLAAGLNEEHYSE